MDIVRTKVYPLIREILDVHPFIPWIYRRFDVHPFIPWIYRRFDVHPFIPWIYRRFDVHPFISFIPWQIYQPWIFHGFSHVFSVSLV
jgi:hypothetical protein